NTTEQAQHDALREQGPDNAEPACAERGPYGDFLLASFDPHQKKIRDIGAGNKQDDADTAHEHPKDFAETANYLLLQRPEGGLEAGLFKKLRAESGRRRELAAFHGDHAGDIGICALEGHAGFQAGDAVVAVIAKRGLAAIEPKRLEEVRVSIEQAETGRHHADDFAEISVDVDEAAHGGARAAELPLPIAVADYDGSGGAGRVVLAAEPAAEDWRNTKRGKRIDGDVYSLNLFRSAEAGDAYAVVVPDPEPL